MSQHESVCVCVCHCLESIVKLMTLYLTAPLTDTCTDTASGPQTALILAGGAGAGAGDWGAAPYLSVRSLTLIREGQYSLRQDFNQHLFI